MAEKRADLVGSFGRKDVLELARLLFDFGFTIHGETVGEQSLRQAMPPDDAARAIVPAWGEFDDQGAIADRCGHWFQRVMAGIHERLVFMGMRRVRSRSHQSHGNHLLNR